MYSGAPSKMIVLLSLFSLHLFGQVVKEWQVSFDSGLANSFDIGADIAVDLQGNAYIAGVVTSVNFLDFAVLRYNNDGQFNWVDQVSPLFAHEARFIDIDGNGDIVASGFLEDSTGTFNLLTAKYQSDGTRLWLREFSNSVGDGDEPWGLAIGKNNRVHVVGDNAGAWGSQPALFTIAYNYNGDSLWHDYYISPDTLQIRRGALAVAPDGALTMAAGLLAEGSRFWGSVFVQFDSSGQRTAETIVPDHWIDTGNDILAYGSNGHLYSAGWNLQRFQVVEIDRSGQLVQNYIFPKPDSTFNLQGRGLLLTQNNSPILIGTANTSLTFIVQQIAVKFFADGSVDWVWRGALDSLNTGNGEVFAELNNHDNIFIAAGARQVGVAKIDHSGQEEWRITEKPVSQEGYQVNALALDHQDNPIITGFWRNTSSDWDILVMKFTEQTTGLARAGSLLPQDFSLLPPYPNPFNPETRIEVLLPAPLTDFTIAIFDVRGRLVDTIFSGDLAVGVHSFRWNTGSLQGKQAASGVYFVRAGSDRFRQARKLVLLR